MWRTYAFDKLGTKSNIVYSMLTFHVVLQCSKKAWWATKVENFVPVYSWGVDGKIPTARKAGEKIRNTYFLESYWIIQFGLP